MTSADNPRPPAIAARGANRLAFFTPSFRGDLERLLVMRRSLKRFFTGAARHVVAVPKQDLALFATNLYGDDVEIVSQNDLVEGRFYAKWLYRAIQERVPSQMWRFSAFAGRPGWIVQQIVKCSLPALFATGPVVLLDSDLFFSRPFSADIFDDGATRMLLKYYPRSESGMHADDMTRARDILGLPAGATHYHYIGWPGMWYPDWMTELQRFLAARHKCSWQTVLYRAVTFSEYCIYGVFVEEILKPSNLRVRTHPMHRLVWDRQSYETFMEERGTMTESNDGPICVIVQSNLGIAPSEYAHIVERVLR